MTPSVQRLEFTGHSGASLSARLDMPNGPIRAYALFAHCFTCSKDYHAVRRISAELSREGIAVLRFDFTGLGASEGDFESTGFTSNVDDLVSAADFLREHYDAPTLLIGHSLGGSAVLVAAGRIPEVKAVVTIGAPSDTEHVLRSFHCSLDEIEKNGSAEVTLGGRTFSIGRDFVEDIRAAKLRDTVAALRRPLLVLHSPLDQVVGIDNANAIFTAAKHPKSFVSLDHADHLLSDPADAAFAAAVIAGWAGRYIAHDEPQGEAPIETVRVRETGLGNYQNTVHAGRHRLFADEPVKAGGMDTGPSPYDFLSIALGACTSMTLRIYADFKKLKLGRISVDVSHKKVHANDCADCNEELRHSGAKIDRFDRVITIEGDLPDEMANKIEEIANKCPVHRTLLHAAHVATTVERHG